MAGLRAPDPVRTLVLWCPDWPLVAAGVAPGDAAVVVHANRVVAVSPAARAEGVEVGLRRRDAQGRCPSLVVHPTDPDAEARAFEPVVAALEALTPGVELRRAGQVALATRGPSRYFGGDAALAQRAGAAAAAALGPAVAVAGPPQVGVADGPFAAQWAARLAPEAPGAEATGPRWQVVPPGGSPAFLAPLAVGAIGQPELADLLVRLGITTLGGLAALPPADVTARFGPEGAAARLLAAGLDARPPDARRPPPDLAAVAELDPPALQVEQVAFVARPLAEELVERLAAHALACTRLLIEVETEHDEVQRRCWRDEGALTPVAMAERVRWQLDGWLSSPRRPTGGIAWLRLVPDEVVPDRGAQLGFWGGRSRGDERAARALARVEGLLGPEAVTVPERRGGRSPAEQVVRVPASTSSSGGGERPRGPSPDHPAGGSRRPRLGLGRKGAARSEPEPWPGRIPPPAPAVVHLHPLPAALVDAHDRLVVVSGRGMISAPPVAVAIDGGRPQAVLRWAGPWVADERWWDAEARRRRARLQVVTPAGAHLLALEGGSWWAEATYD